MTSGGIDKAACDSSYRAARIVCNLRIDHESYPRLSENDFAEGQRWEVTAYLNPYFDNYQLALLNYTPTNCHLIETSSEAAL